MDSAVLDSWQLIAVFIHAIQLYMRLNADLTGMQTIKPGKENVIHLWQRSREMVQARKCVCVGGGLPSTQYA